MKKLLPSILCFTLLSVAALSQPESMNLEQIIGKRKANMEAQIRLLQQKQKEGIGNIGIFDLAVAQMNLLSYERDHAKNIDEKISLQKKIVALAQSTSDNVTVGFKSSVIDALDNLRAQELYLSALETLFLLQEEKEISQQAATPEK